MDQAGQWQGWYDGEDEKQEGERHEHENEDAKVEDESRK